MSSTWHWCAQLYLWTYAFSLIFFIPLIESLSFVAACDGGENSGLMVSTHSSIVCGLDVSPECASPECGAMLSLVGKGTVCVLDRISLLWEISDWASLQQQELVWAGLYKLGDLGMEPADLRQSFVKGGEERLVTRFDLFRNGFSKRSIHESPTLEVEPEEPVNLLQHHSTIQCLIDGPYKIPSVTMVEWRTVPEDSLTLNFTEATNAPPLPDAMSVNNAIEFNNGDLRLAQGHGVWSIDGLTLTLTGLDQDSWGKAVSSISSGNFVVLPRKKILIGNVVIGRDKGEGGGREGTNISGKVALRFLTPGRYTARLFIGDVMVAMLQNVVEVISCEEEVIAESGDSVNALLLQVTDKQIFPGVEVLDPFFTVKGVLALPGLKWFKIPHSVFPLHSQSPSSDVGRVSGSSTWQGQHSWTMSFWLNLQEDSTGSFRALLFKGHHVQGENRTPSAYLHPFSNRLSVRVTSSVDPDIGVDSSKVLPIQEWTHLAFVFDNSTQGAFSLALYVNGKLDVSAMFQGMDILANDGPLYLGQDPAGNPGTRSFISMLRLWNTPLSPEEVASDHRSTSAVFAQVLGQPLSSQYPAVAAIASVIAQPISGGDSRIPPINIPGIALSRLSNDEEVAEAGGIQLSEALFLHATSTTSLCRPFSERLEAYRIAAEAGHTEGQLRYASLLLNGKEEIRGTGSSCPRSKEKHNAIMAEAQWRSEGATKAVQNLALATQGGSYQAAFILSVLILSGLDEGASMVSASTRKEAGTQIIDGVQHTSHPRSVNLDPGLAVPGQLAGRGADTLTKKKEATARAIGLLHFSALGGVTEAQIALGLRYLKGRGVEMDIEAASWYFGCAADAAWATHHTVGGQPMNEYQRLTEANEAVVDVGQRGEDDNTIQYQIMRAEQGHVPSMAALGELYYWGARGVIRDQARALHYFNMAADKGNNAARCAAAGMYLKGEGTGANHTLAVELYESAAAEGHVRALNGLGYESFFGNVLPKDQAKAFEYFERAAGMKEDADSLFNAAHCLATGSGVEKDIQRAASLFRLGAAWGHFDSMYEMGILSSQGETIARSPKDAALYFKAAAQVGSWGGRLRAGFDCYIEGDILCSIASYAEAAEIGYEVGASNAAYILDHGAFKQGEQYQDLDNTDPESEKAWIDAMRLRFHILAAEEGHAPSYLAIGDAWYYGRGGLQRDSVKACWWYSRASYSGLARGSYNLGYMYEHGLGVTRNYGRAWTYYERVGSMPRVDNDPDGLSGLTTHLLVLCAKTRLLLNRFSGGQLAYLWIPNQCSTLDVYPCHKPPGLQPSPLSPSRAGMENTYTEETSRFWLPGWLAGLQGIVDKLHGCLDWLTPDSSGNQSVLDHRKKIEHAGTCLTVLCLGSSILFLVALLITLSFLTLNAQLNATRRRHNRLQN